MVVALAVLVVLLVIQSVRLYRTRPTESQTDLLQENARLRAQIHNLDRRLTERNMEAGRRRARLLDVENRGEALHKALAPQPPERPRLAPGELLDLVLLLNEVAALRMDEEPG